MTDALFAFSPPDAARSAPARAAEEPLSGLRPGDSGVIVSVGASAEMELERRLLEFGFVEGARVELLHEGAFGRDPIAIRVDDNMRVALRRKEAAHIMLNVTHRRARRRA